MIEKFYPSFFYANVESISYDFLKKENIKAIIFDMDNTLVSSKYKYTKGLESWIKGVKKQGIQICILSNTPRYKKVKKIAEELSMPFLYHGLKPWSFGFKKAMDILKVEKENVVIVGDQIFTDVLGGNLFGIRTILVEPIDNEEVWITKIKRPFENIVLKKYKKQVVRGE